MCKMFSSCVVWLVVVCFACLSHNHVGCQQFKIGAKRVFDNHIVFSKTAKNGGDWHCQIVWTKDFITKTKTGKYKVNIHPPINLFTVHDCEARNLVAGVGCLPGDEGVVWVDGRSGSLRSIRFSNNSASSIEYVGFGSVAYISVDWLSGNLYWVDEAFYWIAMKSLWTTDTEVHQSYSVVVDKWMRNAQQIAVYSQKGLLFWTKNGNNAMIERSSLTGTDRVTILWRGLYGITSIAIDDIEDRIYWTSFSLRVQSCDLDGHKCRVVVLHQPLFASLTVAPLLNLVITSASKLNRLYFYTANDGVMEFYTDSFMHREKVTVKIVDVNYCDNRHDGRPYSLCRMKGCQHYCARVKGVATCICKNGYVLGANGITCTATAVPARSIVFVSASHLCSFKASNNTNVRPGNNIYGVHCIISNVTGMGCMAMDSNQGRLFYPSVHDASIQQLSLITGDTHLVISDVANVTCMTYDWLSGWLYWVERRVSRDVIHYVHTPDVHQHSVLRTRIGSLRCIPDGTIADIAIDPYLKNMYVMYTSLHNLYRVHIAQGCTHVEKVYVPRLLSIPRRLFYNPETSLITIAVDGEVIIIPSEPGVPASKIGKFSTSGPNFAVTVYKEFLMTTNNMSMLIVSTRSLRGVKADLPSFYGEITDLAVFDPVSQPLQRDPCLVNNGDCDHICAREKSGRRCGCYLGYIEVYTRDSDVLKCDSYPVTDKFLILSYIFGGYLQLSLHNHTASGLYTAGMSQQYKTAMYSVMYERLYWVEPVTQNVVSGTLNASDQRPIISFFEGHSVSLMKIDQSTSNLYLIMDNNALYVYTHDGRNRRKIQLLSHDKFKLKDIALHPKRGIMFASMTELRKSEDGKDDYSSYIARFNMDGSHFLRIVTDIYASSIAVDYVDEKLYWANYYKHAIHCSDLYGKKESGPIWQGRGLFPRSIAVHDDMLYFTTGNGLLSMPKKGGKVQTIAASMEIGIILQISVFDRRSIANLQINEECSKNNGRCSTLCLPNLGGHRCACGDGDLLGEDDRTCASVLVCAASILGGRFMTECTRYPRSRCEFYCDDGYHRAPNVTNDVLQCGDDSNWDTRIDHLCVVDTDVGTVGSKNAIGLQEGSIIGLSVLGLVVVVVLVIVVRTISQKRQRRKNEDDRQPIIHETGHTRVFRRRSSEESAEYTAVTSPEDARDGDVTPSNNKWGNGTRRCERLPSLPHARIVSSDNTTADTYTAPCDELPPSSLSSSGVVEKIGMHVLRQPASHHSHDSASVVDGAQTYRILPNPFVAQLIENQKYRLSYNDPSYKLYNVIRGDETLPLDDDSSRYTFPINSARTPATSHEPTVPVNIGVSNSKDSEMASLSSDMTYKSDETASNHDSYTTAERQCMSIDSISCISDDVFLTSHYSSLSHSPTSSHRVSIDTPPRVRSMPRSQDTTNNKFSKSSVSSTCRCCNLRRDSGYDSQCSPRKRFQSEPGGDCRLHSEPVQDAVNATVKRLASYLEVIP